MCRIVGVSYGPKGPGAEDFTPTQFLKNMLKNAVYQGPDAFGWMWYDGESIYFNKYDGSAAEDESQELIGIEDESKVRWIVGHTRWATHGDSSNEHNNHPIIHGRVIGVHNGVLRNHESILAETGREFDDAEVDSEAIFAAVNKWGHKEGIKKIRGDLVAVYASLQNPENLYMARTFGRDLVLAHTAGGALVFASAPQIVSESGIKVVTAFSPLRRDRIIRVKDGQVNKRMNLYAAPVPTAWSAPDTSSPLRPVAPGERRFPGPSASRRMQWEREAAERGEITNPAVRDAGIMAQRAARRERLSHSVLSDHLALRDAASKPEAKFLQDHDVFMGFYYLNGFLMTESDYMVAIADEEKAMMDEYVDQAGKVN